MPVNHIFRILLLLAVFSLPNQASTNSATEEADICPICYDDLKGDVFTTSCNGPKGPNHRYHRSCLCMATQELGHQCPLCGQFINPDDLTPRIAGQDASMVIDYVRKLTVAGIPIVYIQYLYTLHTSYGPLHEVSPSFLALLGIVMTISERVYTLRTARIQRLWDGSIGEGAYNSGPLEILRSSYLLLPFAFKIQFYFLDLYRLKKFFFCTDDETCAKAHEAFQAWENDGGWTTTERRQAALKAWSSTFLVVFTMCLAAIAELAFEQYLMDQKKESYKKAYESADGRYNLASLKCSQLRDTKQLREIELLRLEQTVREDPRESVESARGRFKEADEEYKRSLRLVDQRLQERHFWHCLKTDTVYGNISGPL